MPLRSLFYTLTFPLSAPPSYCPAPRATYPHHLPFSLGLCFIPRPPSPMFPSCLQHPSIMIILSYLSLPAPLLILRSVARSSFSALPPPSASHSSKRNCRVASRCAPYLLPLCHAASPAALFCPEPRYPDALLPDCSTDTQPCCPACMFLLHCRPAVVLVLLLLCCSVALLLC